MGNYRPFLQGPLPVANYTRIIIPGRLWTRPPSTKSARMASSATPLHDSLIELAIPDAHAHAIKWYLKLELSRAQNPRRAAWHLSYMLQQLHAEKGAAKGLSQGETGMRLMLYLHSSVIQDNSTAHSSNNPSELYRTPHCGVDVNSTIFTVA